MCDGVICGSDKRKTPAGHVSPAGVLVCVCFARAKLVNASRVLRQSTHEQPDRWMRRNFLASEPCEFATEELDSSNERRQRMAQLAEELRRCKHCHGTAGRRGALGVDPPRDFNSEFTLELLRLMTHGCAMLQRGVGMVVLKHRGWLMLVEVSTMNHRRICERFAGGESYASGGLDRSAKERCLPCVAHDE